MLGSIHTNFQKEYLSFLTILQPRDNNNFVDTNFLKHHKIKGTKRMAHQGGFLRPHRSKNTLIYKTLKS